MQLKIRVSRVVLALSLATCAVARAQSASPVRWQPLYEPGQGGATVSVQVNPLDPTVVISGGDMLGAAISRDRGESWSGTFGFAAYEMSDVTFHPTDKNVVWFGSCMGPYKSTDGGVNFVEKRNGMPARIPAKYSVIVEKVLIDPKDTNHLFAIGGTSRRWAQADTFGWVWESTDAGENWTHLSTIKADGGSSPETVKGVNLVAVGFVSGSNTKLVALGERAGVFISDDAGKTWRVSNQGLPHTNVFRLATHPSDPNVLWVSLGVSKREGQKLFEPGGIFKSTDGGATWQSIVANLPQDRDANSNFTAHYDAFAVSPVNPDVIWADDARWNTGTIYKTEDGGKHWRTVATKGNVGLDDAKRPDGALIKDAFRLNVATFGGCALTGLVADPKDVNTAYGFGTEYILRTTDGGKTWADISATQPDPSKPDNWRGRGFTGWCSNNVAYNPYKPGQWVVQGMDAARVWISDDDLQSFRYGATSPHPWLGGNDVSFSRDGKIFITTGQFGQTNGVIRSTDGGKTFQTLGGGTSGLPAPGWNKGPDGRGVFVHPEQSNRVNAVLGGKMMYSADGGDSWTEVAPKHGFGYIAPDPTKPGRFYVSAKDGVYVSDDGQTYLNTGGPRPQDRARMNCDSLGRVYACQWRKGRSGVWRYTPDAAADASKGTWERLLDDNEAYEVNADPTDPNRLALVTSQDPFYDNASGNGVWISSDAGKSWTKEIEGLPMLRACAVTFDPKGEKLVIGTYGRGFFTAPWPKNYAPAGPRTYAATEEDRAAALVTVQPILASADNGPTISHVVRDLGDLDYTYGESWKKGSTVTAVTEEGVKCLKIDATENGGGGMVLNGADITPKGETHLAIRAKLLPGNEATKLSANLKGPEKSVAFDLGKLSADTWTTLLVVLPGDAGIYKKVDQIQFQGTNFSPGAKPLKILIDRIGTTTPDAKVEEETSEPKNSTSAAPAKDKPNTPAWGFYPKFPDAWMQTFKGQVDRTKKGVAEKNIDIVFIGDSIMQGWGGSGKAVWAEKYKPLKAVNYGIGGDSTRQVLYRIENGILDGISPKVVVLMIGTNNLYGDFNAGSEKEIADGITACVKAIRDKCPQAKVLLLGILPRQNEYFCTRIEKINAVVAKLDDGSSVRFLDMKDAFETEKGKVKTDLFIADQLHINAKGYEVSAKQMQQLFDELQKQ